MMHARLCFLRLAMAGFCLAVSLPTGATGHRSVIESPQRPIAFQGGAPAAETPVPSVSSTVTVPVETSPLLAKQAVYDDALGYLRLSQVTAGLAEAMRAALQSMQATNDLKGLVLDLRYANGSDYLEVAKVADLFTGKARVLLKIGETELRSSAKLDPFERPLAVLINRETTAAAETLAGVLGELGIALLVGRGTAGQVLGEAAAPRPILPGGTVLPESGVVPDLTVPIDPADERLYFENPYRILRRNPSTAASEVVDEDGLTNNRPPPFNESELVKRHREAADGPRANPNRSRAPGSPAPVQPVLGDPVLARGLDFVKGFAVHRISRSAP